LQYFLFLAEPLSQDKLLQMLGQFSKFLFNKKESLPKAAVQVKQQKETPRWDRVVKQNVLITDEPTQDIEVNPLEEENVEEGEPIETDWHETSEAEPIGDVDVDEEPLDTSEVP
jgi:hypothetical protein